MRMEKRFKPLRQFSIISETKRKELNLFFEAEQAKREAKIKTRFLQSMSHDMRNAIKWYCGYASYCRSKSKGFRVTKNYSK